MSWFDSLGEYGRYAGGQPKQEAKIDPELARRILLQPDRMSIVQIAKACQCSSADVKAVVWKENQWREQLGMTREEAVRIALLEGSSAAAQRTGYHPATINSWVGLIKKEREDMSRLSEMYPDLESLMKSFEDRTINQWQKEHKMNSSNFYQLKKKYEAAAGITVSEPARRKGGRVARSRKEGTPSKVPAKALLQKMIDGGASKKDIAKYFGKRAAKVDEWDKEYGLVWPANGPDPDWAIKTHPIESLLPNQVAETTKPVDEPESEPQEPTEEEWACRVCGCTELNACPGGCWWVEEDLCSSCADDITPVVDKHIVSTESEKPAEPSPEELLDRLQKIKDATKPVMFPGPSLTSIKRAIIEFPIDDVVHDLEFPDIDAALNYMENYVSKKQAQRLKLFETEFTKKEIPFSFGAMVSVERRE